MTMTHNKRWCVVYRTGGTARPVWRRTLAYATRAEAEQAQTEIVRMGYRAIVEDYDASVAVGLPVGWAYSPLGEDDEDFWYVQARSKRVPRG